MNRENASFTFSGHLAGIDGFRLLGHQLKIVEHIFP